MPYNEKKMKAPKKPMKKAKMGLGKKVATGAKKAAKSRRQRMKEELDFMRNL